MPGRALSLSLLLLATMAGMSLWFMSAAVLPDMAAEVGLADTDLAWLSSVVPAGFAAGAMFFALTGIPDRVDPRRVFAACALGTALANAALLAVPIGGPGAIALRFLSGGLMAGIWPIAMKIAVGWSVRSRGLLMGTLVAALVGGQATPYLLAWFGGADWRLAVTLGSCLAASGALLVLFTGLGPHHARATAFRARAIGLAWTNRRIRAAILGYLGHMWEFIAFWSWVGAATAASYAATIGIDGAVSLGKLTAFLCIFAASPACILSGWAADRVGKARVAAAALAISGASAILTALTFGGPVWLTFALAIVWGAAVVPDSPQFSALVADNAPPELVGSLLTFQASLGFLLTVLTVQAQAVEGQEEKGAKFSDYFAHTERWSGVPSHRALAMMRGSAEGVLKLDIAPDPETGRAQAERMVAGVLGIAGDAPGDLWLRDVAGWTWRVKLSLSMTLDLMADLRRRAQEEAIRVFARNLKDLLLAAPAGARPTMGLDPGIRTGVKVAVVDATGKLLDTATVYPFQPKNDVRGTQATLSGLTRKHGVELVAIGNGTGSRETEKLVAEVLSDLPAPKPIKVIVSEAGASVYSASELASREFPDLDVSLRGAVSIARRLQDPLAELVKIEPKAIGVGQYQHDVDQHRLGRALDGVVEDAVNAVGVDLNMASAPLLARVSGVGPSLAEAIVALRNEKGAFRTRKDLLSVPRLGPKAFEQCAGFLRIEGGPEPLDGSAVHPEAYSLARRIVKACGTDLRTLMGDETRLRALEPRDFVDGKFGLPTVRDIMAELGKPGRDPRPDFETATFAEGVDEIRDLKPGMQLEGTVTNVAAFGAFVDIGVHQDGLVHISQIADRFVQDPHEVVKAGDVVKVRVVEVDVARKRIGLSMRRDNGTGEARSQTVRKNHKAAGPVAKIQHRGSRNKLFSL